MAGTSIYVRKDGLKQDREVHGPILGAVDFTKSPAFKYAIKRAQRLGLSEKEAKELLAPTKHIEPEED